MKAAIAFTLAVCASAGVLNAENEHIVPMPMHQSKQECGMETSLHFKPDAPAFIQHDNVPGAGVLDKTFKAFKTVLKDGYLDVACVKDYMYYRGDKFGDNKHDYKLGPVSGVSIVHYEAHVAKEDQKEMTPARCFEFCRTVPNMGFFGIVNGRGCYCTPYFQAMESDSSQCDAGCVGDSTQMCGGKSKSSVWAMHMCDSTKDDLLGRQSTASSMGATLGSKLATARDSSQNMQRMGEKWQPKYGSVGDSGAGNLMQDAKVFAGTLEHKVEDAEKAKKKLEELAVKQTVTSDPATVTKAERTMEDIDEAVAQGEAMADELDKLNALAHPQDAKAGAAKQYYPVMYFVDKKFQDMPTTCAGAQVAKPIEGVSQDGCASACDAAIHSCVGYQYFKDGSDKLCFLFSKFSTAFSYTGCKNNPSTAQCFAKVSKFEGTTLKPNPSGKCDQCFKKVTNANRCYE